MEEEIPFFPIESIHILQCIVQDHTTVLTHLIEEYGDVLAVRHDKTIVSEFVHDFAYYCITKGTRTLGTIDVLLTNKYLQDTLILLRSVYESYLNAAYCVNHPDKTNNLISAPVGLYVGWYENPKSKKGKPIRHQIINPNTNEAETFLISIEEMSKGTGNDWDAKSHRKFYSFLSEFAHVHMIASGAYRTEDELHYTLEVSDDALSYTMMHSAYVSSLLLEFALSIAAEDSVIKRDYTSIFLENSDFIIENIEKMSFGEEFENLQDSMINRLKTPNKALKVDTADGGGAI